MIAQQSHTTDLYELFLDLNILASDTNSIRLDSLRNRDTKYDFSLISILPHELLRLSDNFS